MMPAAQRFSLLVFGSLLLVAQSLSAQSLPPPSRTVYKCVVGGRTVYTDAPCEGARRIHVEPTRGLDKSSGTVRTGHDVARERFNEQIDEALKPLTGLTPKQADLHRRRFPLSADAQIECARLDRDIAAVEVAERAASAGARSAVQRELFVRRSRHRELRC